jgi:hypothetical protein
MFRLIYFECFRNAGVTPARYYETLFCYGRRDARVPKTLLIFSKQLKPKTKLLLSINSKQQFRRIRFDRQLRKNSNKNVILPR